MPLETTIERLEKALVHMELALASRVQDLEVQVRQLTNERDALVQRLSESGSATSDSPPHQEVLSSLQNELSSVQQAYDALFLEHDRSNGRALVLEQSAREALSRIDSLIQHLETNGQG